MSDLKVYINKFLVNSFSRRAIFSEVLQVKRVMVIAPHPDDEILGAGGILLEAIRSGSEIHLVYLTDGEASGVWPDPEEIKRQRIALSLHICNQLKIPEANIHRFHLKDGEVPGSDHIGFEDAVTRLKALIEQTLPEVVFATHSLDYWPTDHIACAHMAREAVNRSSNKPKLWYYWVWAWYNIRPWQLFTLNYKKIVRVDTKTQIAFKKHFMGIYLHTLTPDGNPWSGVLPAVLVKALAQPFEIIELIET